MSRERCPACNSPVKVAPGIGPYCPNKECDRLDDLHPFNPGAMNVCENGDHPAPAGQRFCSMKCQEEDSLQPCLGHNHQPQLGQATFCEGPCAIDMTCTFCGEPRASPNLTNCMYCGKVGAFALEASPGGQAMKVRCVHCSKLVVDLKKHEARRHPGMTAMDRLSIAAWRLER